MEVSRAPRVLPILVLVLLGQNDFLVSKRHSSMSPKANGTNRNPKQNRADEHGEIVYRDLKSNLGILNNSKT